MRQHWLVPSEACEWCGVSVFFLSGCGRLEQGLCRDHRQVQKRLHANLQDLRIGNAHVFCDEDSVAQCSQFRRCIRWFKASLPQIAGSEGSEVTGA